MEKEIKYFLRRMIKNKGFVAKGVYSENHHYWNNNNDSSLGVVDIVMFHIMRRNEYIRKDITGRYYPTEKGRKFAMPWYKKVFDVI